MQRADQTEVVHIRVAGATGGEAHGHALSVAPFQREAAGLHLAPLQMGHRVVEPLVRFGGVGEEPRETLAQQFVDVIAQQTFHSLIDEDEAKMVVEREDHLGQRAEHDGQEIFGLFLAETRFARLAFSVGICHLASVVQGASFPPEMLPGGAGRLVNYYRRIAWIRQRQR